MTVTSQADAGLQVSGREYKRRLILDAAAEVFARLGHSAASTTEIARRVGMTQSNFYNYFKSKDEALEAICLIALEGYFARMETVLRADYPIKERIYRAVLSHFTTLHEKPDHYVTFLTCRLFLPDEARHRVGAQSRAYEDQIEQMLSQAVARGEISPPDNMTFTVSSFLALCNNIAITKKQRFGMPIDALAKRVADIFINGAVQISDPNCRHPS